MQLIRAELINVALELTEYSNEEDKRRIVSYFLQFGGIICPRLDCLVVDIDKKTHRRLK